MKDILLRIFKIIIKIVFNVIMILIVCLALILGSYFVQTRLMKKNYANIFGFSFFEVSTGSMANTINVGDLIIIKINDNYQENDIIVYQENEALITHRVIKITDNTLITKGDANNTEDSQIRKNMVVGKVIKIVHNIASIKKIILMPQVIIPIAIILLLFGMLIWLKI